MRYLSLSARGNGGLCARFVSHFSSSRWKPTGGKRRLRNEGFFQGKLIGLRITSLVAAARV